MNIKFISLVATRPNFIKITPFMLAINNYNSNTVKVIRLLVVGVLFTFLLEAVQYVLPYRAFNINDLLANGLGVVLGFSILIVFPVILSLSKGRPELKSRN